MRDYKEISKKRRATLIERYGSEQAYLEYMRDKGRKGGVVKVQKGFSMNRELASKMGKRNENRVKKDPVEK